MCGKATTNARIRRRKFRPTGEKLAVIGTFNEGAVCAVISFMVVLLVALLLYELGVWLGLGNRATLFGVAGALLVRFSVARLWRRRQRHSSITGFD